MRLFYNCYIYLTFKNICWRSSGGVISRAKVRSVQLTLVIWTMKSSDGLLLHIFIIHQICDKSVITIKFAADSDLLHIVLHTIHYRYRWLMFRTIYSSFMIYVFSGIRFPFLETWKRAFLPKVVNVNRILKPDFKNQIVL